MLLVDGVPVKAKADGTVDGTLDSAGINNNSALTVVAKQPVFLRCHRDNWGCQKSETIAFESCKRLGESRLPSADFVLYLVLRSFNSSWRTERW